MAGQVGGTGEETRETGRQMGGHGGQVRGHWGTEDAERRQGMESRERTQTRVYWGGSHTQHNTHLHKPCLCVSLHFAPEGFLLKSRQFLNLLHQVLATHCLGHLLGVLPIGICFISRAAWSNSGTREDDVK